MTRILPFFLLLLFPPQLAESEDRNPPAEEIHKRCLAVLRKGLLSEEFWPAMHAAEGLTYAGYGDEVIDRLTPLLETETDGQRRCGIARELVRAGVIRQSRVMLELLTSNDPYAHVHAAESLYKVGWQGEGAPVVHAFQESKDARLQIMAAAALAKHGTTDQGKEALAYLRNVLRDEPDPDIFRLSSWVLARVGDTTDIDLLRKRMPDANGELARAMLEHALAALGDPEGQAALLRNLASTEPAVKAQAATFAGEFHVPDSQPVLVEMLDDPVLDARIRAAHSLLVPDP